MPVVAGGTWEAGPQFTGAVHVAFLRPDVHGLTLSPEVPEAGEDVMLTYETGWVSGQTVAYRWFVNEEEVPGADEATLAGSEFTAGAKVRAELTATLPTLAAGGEVVRSLEATATARNGVRGPWARYR